MEGLNVDAPKCGAELSVNRRVLRQTSGALRRTEGSWRPRSARTRRKSPRLEALKPHGKAGNQVVREILRPERHLRSMRDDALRDCRTGWRKIRNQANGLSRVAGIRPGRTLTAPASLAANPRQSRLRSFPCGKAVTAMWQRAILRKTRPPKIFRRFADGKVRPRAMRRELFAALQQAEKRLARTVNPASCLRV
jgi:hypothetical protein